MEQIIDPYPVCPDKSLSVSHSNVWRLIKSYWLSNQRFPAYLFFSIVMVLTVSLVGLDLIFNYWYYYFYGLLQAYDTNGVVRLLLVSGMLSAFYLLFTGYRYCLSQIFGSRWRRLLTERFIWSWLEKRSHELLKGCGHENTVHPEQRLQKDLDGLINYSIDLSMGLIGVITTFLVMVYVLWQLSGEMNVSLGSWGTVSIPGYWVWAGVIYAAVGTFVTCKIGRPLLTPDLVQKQKLLWRFSTGCYQLSVVLPLLMVLPSYFDKVFLLSWLIQSLQAFNRVQGSLSCVVNSYATPSVNEEQAQPEVRIS